MYGRRGIKFVIERQKVSENSPNIFRTALTFLLIFVIFGTFGSTTEN